MQDDKNEHLGDEGNKLDSAALGEVGLREHDFLNKKHKRVSFVASVVFGSDKQHERVNYQLVTLPSRRYCTMYHCVRYLLKLSNRQICPLSRCLERAKTTEG